MSEKWPFKDYIEPPQNLVWLYSHCKAIGMDCKSDSGEMEHDIALFTANLVAERDALANLCRQEPVARVGTINTKEAFVYADKVPAGTLLYAAPQLPQREGWQLVPKEPTKEMLEAARTQAWVDAKQLRPMKPLNATTWDISAINRYKAMLAAAPKPEDTP